MAVNNTHWTMRLSIDEGLRVSKISACPDGWVACGLFFSVSNQQFSGKIFPFVEFDDSVLWQSLVMF